MRTKTWEISDELWEKVAPLIPDAAQRREVGRIYKRKPKEKQKKGTDPKLGHEKYKKNRNSNVYLLVAIVCSVLYGNVRAVSQGIVVQ